MKILILLTVISTCLHMSISAQKEEYANNIDKDSSAINGMRTNLPSSSRTNLRKIKPQNTGTQRLDIVIEFNYNEVQNSWDKKFIKESYNYNNDGHLVSSLLYSYDNTNEKWIPLRRESFSYDSQGRVNSYVFSVYIGNNQWNQEDREEYKYNEKGELTEATSYRWKPVPMEWQIATRWNYSYTENGKYLKDNLYLWNKEKLEWILHEKLDYSYINGKKHYIYKSTREENKWIPTEKKWYLYTNINWELISLTTFKWDSNANDWKKTNVKGYGYNDNFEPVSRSNAWLPLDNSESIEIFSEHYKYNYEFDFHQLALPFLSWQKEEYSSFIFHHQLKTKVLKKRDTETNENITYRMIKYYYSNANSTAIPENSDFSLVEIYPNPTTNYIMVKMPDNMQQVPLELFDITGTKVLSVPASRSSKYSLGNIKSGIYLYRLTIQNQIKTGKLIIN